MKKALLTLIVLIVCSQAVFAEKVIDIRELTGNNRFIEVSLKEMNYVKMPYPIKGIKSSKKAEIKFKQNDRQFFVTLTKNEPTELYIILNDSVDKERVVSVILIPKNVPSTGIEITDPTKKNDLISRAEKSLPYEIAIRNIILTGKQNIADSGYSKKSYEDQYLVTKTEQLSLRKVSELSGYLYKLETWEVNNITESSLFLKETDFYVHGMRAISIDDNNLEAGDTTLLYIVYPIGG
jgi:hypothetical protein